MYSKALNKSVTNHSTWFVTHPIKKPLKITTRYFSNKQSEYQRLEEFPRWSKPGTILLRVKHSFNKEKQKYWRLIENVVLEFSWVY